MAIKQKKKNKSVVIRKITQIFFFMLVALIAINHQLAETGGGIPFLSNASLHALCPFGGVVTIYQYATAGTFVQKIHASSFILMVIGFLAALLFGPAFCGWVCPLGTFQEWIGGIGKKIFKRKFNHFIPEKLDRVLRYLRYGVLAWVVFMTAVSGKLLFANIDPYFALFNFWTSEAALGGLVVLGVTMTLSLFTERPWCKYACPYGAVLGVFNGFRFFKIQRKASTCIDCGACNQACPMNIDVASSTTVRDHQCISCLECTSEAACPVQNTIQMQSGKIAQ